MPEYYYTCEKCKKTFSTFKVSVSQYIEKEKCPTCNSTQNVYREYQEEGFYSSIRLSDGEIKTVGHLAERNTENMSDDELKALNRKNTAYLREQPKDLPSGMKRVTKAADFKSSKKKGRKHGKK